ncbi:DMT family transporter [Undibacterium sp. Xuan67W]|uniref:DMT family transporter n=1 Tax=Undibacterium sp. Xuan67W TaxID=3413057 RepID=UPI003BF091FB
MKNKRIWPFLAIHGAVLLFGSAGVLGKTLAVTSLALVFGRTLFASLGLLPVLLIQGQVTWRSILELPKSVFICGILLAIHWLTFFAALKVAPVAYGLMGFASFPLFVAWLEPWLFKEPRHTHDWISALVVLVGMVIMMSDERPDQMSEKGALLGLSLGVVSGFSFALLALLNRWQGAIVAPFTLAFYQNGVACLSLLPFVLFNKALSGIAINGWLGLALLGVVFTALSHGLFMFGLRHVSTRLASLLTSLEPVYGIVLAYFVLHESPSQRVIAGCGIVLLATSMATYLHARKSQ